MMKKIKLLLLILFFSLLLPHSTFAQSFRSWDVEVELLKNGDAMIKNTWITNETKGTEKFLPITNLKDMEILDYSVKDNNVPLIYESNWDIDKSRSEKAGKYGMLQVKNGIELVFGIGEYGEHRYEFQYKVTNFVKNLEDGQTIYWRFVNDKMSPPPESIRIEIKGYEPFTSEKVKMWAFGFPGDIHLEPSGQILARSNEALSTSNYAVILLQFPSGYFDASTDLNMTMEEQQQRAFQGSDYGEGGESSNGSSPIKDIIAIGVAIIFGLLGIVGLFLAIRESLRYRKRTKHYKSYRNKIYDLKEQYYREIPYDGSPGDLEHILRFSSIVDTKTIISSYLLKWIHEEAIKTQDVEEGTFFKNRELALKFIKEPNFLSPVESQFYLLLQKAIEGKEILTPSQLNRYMKKNYTEYDAFEKEVKDHSIEVMTEKGYMTLELTEGVMPYSITHLSESGEKMLDHNIMFRNYLKDYSLLNERKAYDVHLWDEYMIYAGFYGIADEVRKQFNIVEPRYENDSVFYYQNIYWAEHFSHQVESSASSARSEGSGGSSSIGGGGGSFGGGSGGGSR